MLASDGQHRTPTQRASIASSIPTACLGNGLVSKILMEGPFSVELWLDEQGALHRVALPALPPTEVRPCHFLNLLARLSRLPVAIPRHSLFAETVWNQISKIPLGDTCTYSKLATEIGRPQSTRAVGNACGRNPLLIRVPCHRVTAKTGLGGYAAGKTWKQFLLQIEQQTLQTNIAQSSSPTLNLQDAPGSVFSRIGSTTNTLIYSSTL
jgi:O-6-methylguanine DNA methyltransferase